MIDKTMKLITGVEVVDGEQVLQYKSYPYPIYVKGGLVKRAIDIGADMENKDNEFNAKVIDTLADFTVEVYANQFTRDELIDGIQAHELMEKLTDVLQFIIAGEEKKGKSKEFIQEKMS